MKYINQVREFMATMGQDLPAEPTTATMQIQNLRCNLIAEENNELLKAAIEKDIVEVADALCDLRYVVEGAFLAYGFSPELADELFEEVQRSNMTKFCRSLKEAEMTVDMYDLQDVHTKIEEVGDYYTVVRTSDGKVQKSLDWSPPDLKSILQKHGVKC